VSYSKGLLRPDPAKLTRRLHASLHPGIVGGPPKGSAQLETLGRLDQGASGTCHAHSAVGAVWCALKAAGQTPAFVGSPRCLASCTYADVRAASTLPGQPLPLLQDTGADLSDDSAAMARWGLGPIRNPTKDGRYSDVENDPPDNVFPEPVLSELQVAGQDLIGGEYQIPVDANAPALCALALDAGIPIWLGFFVDSAFEALRPGEVAQPPNESDPNGGGHAVYLSGYRTAAGGSFEFRLENSWGSGWCESGACWVSTAWLLKCWMLWPMAVKVAS
jgi:hypothetical protein